jgi:catechol 2,3-dioxygenase
VRLQVADLDRSLVFYLRVLRMRVLRRDGADAVLTAHGDDPALVELHARPGAAPDGMGNEVCADRPRSTWRRVGRELMMATDSADVDGELADDPWGTTVRVRVA